MTHPNLWKWGHKDSVLQANRLPALASNHTRFIAPEEQSVSHQHNDIVVTSVRTKPDDPSDIYKKSGKILDSI